MPWITLGIHAFIASAINDEMPDQQTEFWQKAQHLFARAVELPGGERARFCGDSECR